MYCRPEHRPRHEDRRHRYNSTRKHAVPSQTCLIAYSGAPHSPCTHVSEWSNELQCRTRCVVVERVKECDERTLVTEVSRLVWAHVVSCHTAVVVRVVVEYGIVPVARQLGGVVHEDKAEICHSCHGLEIVRT